MVNVTQGHDGPDSAPDGEREMGDAERQILSPEVARAIDERPAPAPALISTTRILAAARRRIESGADELAVAFENAAETRTAGLEGSPAGAGAERKLRRARIVTRWSGAAAALLVGAVLSWRVVFEPAEPPPAGPREVSTPSPQASEPEATVAKAPPSWDEMDAELAELDGALRSARGRAFRAAGGRGGGPTAPGGWTNSGADVDQLLLNASVRAKRVRRSALKDLEAPRKDPSNDGATRIPPDGSQTSPRKRA